MVAWGGTGGGAAETSLINGVGRDDGELSPGAGTTPSLGTWPWSNGGFVRIPIDLQNLGLTEAQTHEIIPDASATSLGTAPKSPNGSGASGGGPEASSGSAGV
jgi:hypothetical protein